MYIDTNSMGALGQRMLYALLQDMLWPMPAVIASHDDQACMCGNSQMHACIYCLQLLYSQIRQEGKG